MTAALTTVTGVTLNGRPLVFADEPEVQWDDEPHCFLCGRHTDHTGEHEGGVLAGLAAYDGYQVVYTDQAYALMDVLPEGKTSVRRIIAAIDRMEYDAWKRRGLVWTVLADGSGSWEAMSA